MSHHDHASSSCADGAQLHPSTTAQSGHCQATDTPASGDGGRTVRGEAAAVSRRSALKAMLAMAGAATLFANPVRAFATPQATQETLDALSDAQAKYDEV